MKRWHLEEKENKRQAERVVFEENQNRKIFGEQERRDFNNEGVIPAVDESSKIKTEVTRN